MGGDVACASPAGGHSLRLSRKRSGGDGGRLGACGIAVAAPVQGTGRRGEPVAEATSVSPRGASPGAARPRGSSDPHPSLAPKRSRVPWLSSPPTLTRVKCHRATGKLGPEGWTGGAGGCGGAAGGAGWSSGLWGGSCLPPTGAVPPAFPALPFFLSCFSLRLSPLLSHLLSLRLSRLQPCLLEERRCPRPAAGGRCSIAPHGYRF